MKYLLLILALLLPINTVNAQDSSQVTQEEKDIRLDPDTNMVLTEIDDKTFLRVSQFLVVNINTCQAVFTFQQQKAVEATILMMSMNAIDSAYLPLLSLANSSQNHYQKFEEFLDILKKVAKERNQNIDIDSGSDVYKYVLRNLFQGLQSQINENMYQGKEFWMKIFSQSQYCKRLSIIANRLLVDNIDLTSDSNTNE